MFKYNSAFLFVDKFFFLPIFHSIEDPNCKKIGLLAKFAKTLENGPFCTPDKKSKWVQSSKYPSLVFTARFGSQNHENINLL